MKKFKNKYRIPSNRLRGHDYGSQGHYFVTICTKNRVHYFGNIVPVETDNCPSPHNCSALQPTIIGQTAIDLWMQIPNHYPVVELDAFVVMPDHIHGVLFLNQPEKYDWRPNRFGPQSQNLGAIIRAFKASVKLFANQNNIEFEWQSRYYDRIVRNEKALNAIRRYIINNPEKWNRP
jgi:REP element-mobilizing transposase RayT